MADIKELKRLVNAITSAAHSSTVQTDTLAVKDLENVAEATKKALNAIIDCLEER